MKTTTTVMMAVMAVLGVVAPAIGETTFIGGTNTYSLNASWSNNAPGPGNNGTVGSGLARDTDSFFGDYNLLITGGTVAIDRAKFQGLDVTQTGGRWEDSTGGHTPTAISSGLFVPWDTAASTYTLSGTGVVDVLRLYVGRGAVGTFNQNGGSVTTTGTDGLYLGELAGGAGSKYNLAAGTVKTDQLRINGTGTAVNFTTGSTGILYVKTTDKNTAAINGLITGGRITLNGATVEPSAFVVRELSTGTYSGYTEVKRYGPSTFNGGTAQYNLDGSWDTGHQPGSFYDGIVTSGVAYNGDPIYYMGDYNLTIDGGTVAIKKGAFQGLDVTHTAGTWRDYDAGQGFTGAGLFVGWDTAASTYTLSGTGVVDVLRLYVGRGAVGTFNQNGGSVTTTGTDGLYLGELTGGAGSKYNLAAGTVKTDRLRINGTGTAVNFTTGSTGILYVKTTDKNTAAINGLITGGRITLNGATVEPSAFLVRELSAGTYSGYTEVKRKSSVPGTLIMVF